MATGNGAIPVSFVVHGRVVEGQDVEYRSRDLATPFFTPKLDLDELAGSRSDDGPAFDVPVADVVDFLVATGDRLRLDDNPLLEAALAQVATVSSLGERILANCYAEMARLFERDVLEFQLDQELGGANVVDGWRTVVEPSGRLSAVRAYPLRLLHVLAGNSPSIAALSIIRGALTKGVHVLKMASNDLFTPTAILRTMAEIDPDHPTLRSFSAVYWRGGDEGVESVLYRAQWFDKLVAWGGQAAIESALKYVGPGFELVSFDPKASVSFIGHEAFASHDALREVASLGAFDASVLNQDACAASRYQFVEGSRDDADSYCELLASELSVERPWSSALSSPTPAEVRDNVDVLRTLEPDYRVWGAYDGRGLVVRSDEPVDFDPIGKTVNVVSVDALADAVRYVTVATQSIGVYPSSRKAELRDACIGAGAQRVMSLGGAADFCVGLPHDGMYPLHRLVRWAVDEDVEPDARTPGGEMRRSGPWNAP